MTHSTSLANTEKNTVFGDLGDLLCVSGVMVRMRFCRAIVMLERGGVGCCGNWECGGAICAKWFRVSVSRVISRGWCLQRSGVTECMGLR